MTTRRLALGAGLVGLYLLAIGSLAARAQLWNDELYTWYFAQLPTMGDVWDELSTGVEQIPPFYYVVTRASLALFGDGELALRVPSIIGFILACTCLFVVVARRTNASYGLVGALVPLASGAATYAWEARPYALVVGFAAAAVLCHQLRADVVRPRLAVLGLALALAAATGMHYYGVLVVLPIALAEAVRVVMRRQVDWAVVAAFFAPIVPLAVSAPLIQEARRYSGAFWTEFDLGSAAEFFVFLLRADVFSASRIPTWLGIGFATVVLGAALIVLLRRPRTAQTEVAAAVGFLLIPLAGAPRRRARHGRVRRAVRARGRHRACAADPARPPPRGRPDAAAQPSPPALCSALWFGVLFQYWHRDIGVDIDRRERLVAFLEEHIPPNGHRRRRPSARLPRAGALRAQLGRCPARPAERPGASSAVHGKPVERGRARRARRDSHRLRIVAYDEQQAPFLLLRTVRGDARDWIDPALADDGARLDVVARDEDDGFTLVRVAPTPR